MVRRASDHARIEAEASAWLARINGPQRTAATEAALQDWLAASGAHQAAFERATDLWDMLPGAVLAGIGRTREPPRRRLLPMALAASLVAVIGAGTLAYRTHGTVLSTKVGERRSTTLDDGSRLALNTGSRVTTHFARAERRMTLDRGEVLFDVAHDASRPFVVDVGDERVTALGTAFDIRRDGGMVRVTLLRGRVEVRRQGGTPDLLAVLRPGERLTTGSGDRARIDQPDTDAVTAWRRGEILFNGTPLSDAAAEVNRYGRTRVVIDDPRIADLLVSGVFATDDPAEFAQAVAQLHGLHVRRRGDMLLLRS